MTRTQFYYKNHRGVTELRSIEPISLQYVASPHLEYGYAPGWFLHGLDFTERDGVARTGEGRSFSLDHIQMEGFKYGTKGGAAAFHLMLQPGFAPVERAIPEVVLNSETGNEPVNSHGGLAQAVYWTLHVNGELIESESARFPWSTDPAKRELNTRIDKAPTEIKMLFNNLSKAFGTPNPPVEDYKYTSDENASDSLAYLIEAGNHAFERSGIAENFREPGEFGDGATVAVEQDINRGARRTDHRFDPKVTAAKAGVDLGGNPLPVDEPK